MFKNVINSKSKRDLNLICICSIVIFVFGFDTISATYYTNGLLWRMLNTDYQLPKNLTTTPKTTPTTTVEGQSPPSTTVYVRKKLPYQTRRTTWLMRFRPTLVRNKIIRTVLIRVPKRKWHLVNPNFTTYDIDAYRRAKRRKHREFLRNQSILRMIRKKIPTSPKTTVSIFYNRNPFPESDEIPHNTKDWWYNTQGVNDTWPYDYDEIVTENITKAAAVKMTTKMSKEELLKIKMAKLKRREEMETIRQAKKEKLEAERKLAKEKRRSEQPFHTSAETNATMRVRPTRPSRGPTKDSAEKKLVKMREIIKDKLAGKTPKKGVKKFANDDPAGKERYRREKQLKKENRRGKKKKKSAARPKPKKGKDGAVEKF